MITAKFYCSEKGEASFPGGQKTAKLVLHAVNNGSSEENKRFFSATPSGKIEMSIVNPLAAEHFEVGKYYYVDFTPAE